ncbi:MAG: hypothetical protein WA061_01690 [Microgenomates group bacterium]
MTVFDEFQDIEIPKFLDNYNFVDTSWHNNAAPSVDHIISNDKRYLTIWVYDEWDVENGYDKFCVHVYNPDSAEDEFEAVCNSEDECQKAIGEAIVFIREGDKNNIW